MAKRHEDKKWVFLKGGVERAREKLTEVRMVRVIRMM